jgi:NRAMP (natural resistance-associated macrophage protein)-like metal ion transporter
MNIFKKFKLFSKDMGPGIITGASDDDPSGIATYSQAGAAFGYTTLWTAWLTFPLMAIIQEMCARIGLVTAKGLTAIIKEFYPRPLLIALVLFSFPAIVLNIGADIAGMGAVTNLLFPKIPAFVFSILFTLIMFVCLLLFPYKKIARILRMLCLSLLVYFVVPFMVKENWHSMIANTLVPHIQLTKTFFALLVGILGTTISPYLFYWQTTMEAENRTAGGLILLKKKDFTIMRRDVGIGMFFSNLVMFFIILTTAAVLHPAGITQINTVDEAAAALKPLAGNWAYLLFALGVIGTGFLAIPVLCGTLSYMFTETFGWQGTLDNTFKQAKGFYSVMATSLLVGLFLNFMHISPVKALIYTAILYGMMAPPLILIIINIANNKNIMGKRVNGRLSNIGAYLTFILMSAAALGLIFL